MAVNGDKYAYIAEIFIKFDPKIRFKFSNNKKFTKNFFKAYCTSQLLPPRQKGRSNGKLSKAYLPFFALQYLRTFSRFLGTLGNLQTHYSE